MRKWVLVCRAVTVEGKVHMMSHTSSHQARPLPVTLSMWSLKAASSPQVASRFNTTPPPQSHTCVCTWHYASSCTIQARTHSGYWYRPTRGRCWWCVDTEGVQQHLSLNEFSFKCDVKKTPGSSAAFRGGWSPRYPVTHTHAETHNWTRHWIKKYPTMHPLQTCCMARNNNNWLHSYADLVSVTPNPSFPLIFESPCL